MNPGSHTSSPQDLHRRQLLGPGYVEERFPRRQRRLEEVIRLPGQESAQVALFHSFEGIWSVGVDFGRIVDGGDSVIEGDQTTAAHG